jgi:hypothetical protein
MTDIMTIQEMTIQAYETHIFDYFFFEKNMSRTEIFETFAKWAEEFDEIHGDDFDWSCTSLYDEIADFLDARYESLQIEDMKKAAFPYGIAVGDYLSYKGGFFKVTGFDINNILVKTIIGCTDSTACVPGAISFSDSKEVKILSGYEDIMETNGHDPELVKKINAAWNSRRMTFYPIMNALFDRDLDEIMDSEAFDFSEHIDRDEAFIELQSRWEGYAYIYLTNIADDSDLECILNFVHFN